MITVVPSFEQKYILCIQINGSSVIPLGSLNSIWLLTGLRFSLTSGLMPTTSSQHLQSLKFLVCRTVYSSVGNKGSSQKANSLFLFGKYNCQVDPKANISCTDPPYSIKVQGLLLEPLTFQIFRCAQDLVIREFGSEARFIFVTKLR